MERKDTKNVWTCGGCGKVNNGAKCQNCGEPSTNYHIIDCREDEEKQSAK